MMAPPARQIDLRPAPAQSVWPTPAQLQLLRAALWSGEEARFAWAEWRRLENLRALDAGSWGLLPLVWRNLTAQGVHDDVLEECRGFHRYHWARNQQWLRQAATWATAWQARGVPVVALKGAALAAATYPDPGTRPMADVDLLVPVAQVQVVAAQLQADGWRPLADYIAWADVSLETLQSFNWQRGLERFDLHWHVLHRCTRPEVTQLFWERAQPLALPGGTALQLAAEDAFLHVCSHGVQYSDHPPFRWLADAAWILRRAEGRSLDWPRVLDLADRAGASLALRHGLDYAVAELRLPVPAPVLAALRGRRESRRERWAYRLTIEPTKGSRWLRAWALAGLLWRVGGRGAPWTRWRRIRHFLCVRWQSPDLRGVLGLTWRKVWTGHRGTLKVDLSDPS